MEVYKSWIGGKKRGIGSSKYEPYRTMVMGADQTRSTLPGCHTL